MNYLRRVEGKTKRTGCNLEREFDVWWLKTLNTFTIDYSQEGTEPLLIHLKFKVALNHPGIIFFKLLYSRKLWQHRHSVATT